MSRQSSPDDGFVPPGVDPTVPTPARMYDYYLGGKNNYSADREAGEQVLRANPSASAVAWENRRFLQRAVRFLAGRGIRQFLDLGAGLPTQGNVHEIAGRAAPGSRVVYVDNDPIVSAHGRALLAETETTTLIQADIRDPQTILRHAEFRRIIDVTEPVAVLLVAVLHFVTDEHDPAAILRTLREAMAPGSYLALSHVTSDGPPPDVAEQAVKVYDQATAPVVVRSREQIQALFSGLDLVEPGVVRPWQWRPDGSGPERTDWLYAGVGRKTADGK